MGNQPSGPIRVRGAEKFDFSASGGCPLGWETPERSRGLERLHFFRSRPSGEMADQLANYFYTSSMKVILVSRMEQEEPEIAVVGTKGQIVIPQRFRSELKITPKTKLIVYRKGDKLVVTKLKVPPLKEELNDLFREIDQQNQGKTKPTEKEILEVIQAYRREKRTKQGT